jgi:uncharacterized protein YmfQ (DUF2313 family)
MFRRNRRAARARAEHEETRANALAFVERLATQAGTKLEVTRDGLARAATARQAKHSVSA